MNMTTTTTTTMTKTSTTKKRRSIFVNQNLLRVLQMDKMGYKSLSKKAQENGNVSQVFQMVFDGDPWGHQCVIHPRVWDWAS